MVVCFLRVIESWSPPLMFLARLPHDLARLLWCLARLLNHLARPLAEKHFSTQHSAISTQPLTCLVNRKCLPSRCRNQNATAKDATNAKEASLHQYSVFKEQAQRVTWVTS